MTSAAWAGLPPNDKLTPLMLLTGVGALGDPTSLGPVRIWIKSQHERYEIVVNDLAEHLVQKSETKPDLVGYQMAFTPAASSPLLILVDDPKAIQVIRFAFRPQNSSVERYTNWDFHWANPPLPNWQVLTPGDRPKTFFRRSYLNSVPELGVVWASEIGL